jgi:hypothetical protein
MGMRKLIERVSIPLDDSEVIMNRSTMQLIARDCAEILKVLESLPESADLPPWWTNMVAVAQSDLASARDYITTKK